MRANSLSVRLRRIAIGKPVGRLQQVAKKSRGANGRPFPFPDCIGNDGKKPRRKSSGAAFHH
jgi:hypothetical protein